MTSPPALDGLSALALALSSSGASGASGDLEIVCFDLGGEGARRACAALRDAGVSIAAEHGASAASAALGAAAAGALVFLLASGEATVSLARATRAAARAGVVVTGVVLSHGDDVGAVLPLSDGSDLAALASASAERWSLSSPAEVRAWTLARLAQLRDSSAPRCAIAAMDLRAVAMREVTVASATHDHASLSALEAEPRASSSLHASLDPGVVLISCGAGESARVAAAWLGAEGVAARALALRCWGPDTLPALGAALAGARHVLVHDCAGAAGLSALVRSALEPGCALDELSVGRAVDAVDFCEAIARAHELHPQRRAALQASSRALRVQLVGPPATRAAAVRTALSALGRASILAWAERVEPTHALVTVDVGAARAVGSSGWLVVVAGLSVQAPIEPALGATAMLVDAGLRSTLLSARGGDARDQAALVVAVVLVELELRGQSLAIGDLERSLGLGDEPDDPLAWVQVRARADHLRSLR